MYRLVFTLLSPLLAFPASANESKPLLPNLEKTREFLKQLEQPDGGFLLELSDPLKTPASPTLSATSSSLRATKYLFGEIPNRDKHAAFVKKCYDTEVGGFAAVPGGKPDVASTAVGLMAMAELGFLDDSTKLKCAAFLAKNAKTFEERRIAAAGFEVVRAAPPEAKTWIDEIKKTANSDGVYGKGNTLARDTGGTVVLLMRLGSEFTPEEKKGSIQAIKEGQQPDGAYIGADGKTTDLDSTYRVMRAFYMTGQQPPDLKKMREYLSKCQRPNGGYARQPEVGGASASGTYYAAIIAKWIDLMESKK